jgi:spermidine synthase
MIKGNWYIDDYLPNTQVAHRIRRKVVKKKTKYQLVEIVDLYDFGRSVFIDGNPQSAEKSEWIYHECLVHPPMLLGAEAEKKNVLVLGAGEGATARELLKYKNIESITLIDIDKKAVELFKKYLPMMHKGAFNNPKVRLIIDSASDFLKENKQKYDVIISDITDYDFFNLGAKKVRSEQRFCELIASRLRKGGLFAMHAGDLNEDEYATHVNLKKFVKKIFPAVYSYRAYIPFLENEWGFLLASRDKKFNPKEISEKNITKRIFQCGIERKLEYMDTEMLKASFVFSPRLEKIFKKY